MLTFAQFITEKDHYISSYRGWGAIHPHTGEVIHGNKERGVTQHTELADALYKKNPSIKSNAYPEWAHVHHKDGSGYLLVRNVNHGNHAATLKALRNLPHHASGDVELEHGLDGDKRSFLKGKAAFVHNKLKAAGSLTEKEHDYGYSRWGVVSPSGKVVDGDKHRYASDHNQLKIHAATEHHGSDHFAEYLQEPGGKLTFRTQPNHHSVGAAMKAIKKMPANEYNHEHWDGGNTMSSWTNKTGSDREVTAHLQGLHRKLKSPLAEAVNKEGFHHGLVVYHGTSHQFDRFSDGPRHMQTPEREIKGHFFTSDPVSAQSYASRSARDTGGKARVIKAHLQMENPYNATSQIKKHQKAGMSFSDAKNKAFSGVDRTKHDGVYHDGNGMNPSEYVAFHAHHIKPIR